MRLFHRIVLALTAAVGIYVGLWGAAFGGSLLLGIVLLLPLERIGRERRSPIVHPASN